MKGNFKGIKQLLFREKFLGITSFFLVCSIIISFILLICSYKPVEEKLEPDYIPVISNEDTTHSVSTSNVAEETKVTQETPSKSNEPILVEDESNTKTTVESTSNPLTTSSFEESTTNETTTRNNLNYKDDSTKVVCDESKYIFHKIYSKLQNYFDIIVDLTTAIIVSFFGVVVTVFVFLKSALDRIIDENNYIADIANIYKESTAKYLFYVCIIESLTLILTLLWHAYLSFVSNCDKELLFYGLLFLVVSLVFSLAISGWFCKRCIGIETYLRRIIMLECEKLKDNLEKFINEISDKSNNIYNLIGDWHEWDDKDDDYIDEGKKLCNKMTVDQYINLFFRAEMLLLSGENGYNKREEHNSDIITILQERKNILKPNSRVERDDLKGRSYFSPNQLSINESIESFEKAIDYADEEDTDYFNKTQKLYDFLRKYRNYLISWRHTEKKLKIKSEKSNNSPESSEFRNVFSKALYYFVLRLLGTFVCATHISDFSFNGFSLNYANFYNSTLERLTLYSSEFYRTVFARAQISQSEMDISLFYDVDFYGTSFLDSSLSNSVFNFINYDGTRMINTDLSSSDFSECNFINSDFENCLFNNATFKNCKIDLSNFSYSKFKDIICDRFVAQGCDFQYSIIQSWKTDKNTKELLCLHDCNFSNSTWQKMEVLKGTLSGSVFTNSEFIDVSFDETIMESALFLGCNLTSIHFSDCNIMYGSMEKAVLVNSQFDNVIMNMGNLGEVLAVKATFKDCELCDTNCAEADFSEAKFISCNFHGARLYDCSLVKANLEECNCSYLLADHLQFTFALCVKTDFQTSSLAESNLTETNFENCIFDYSDMKNSNASGTKFINCSLNYVDFSDTRFVKSRFISKGDKIVIKNSNFRNCTFEEVRFENVFFENCLFENSTFINCTYTPQHLKAKRLNKKSFKFISNVAKNNITWTS